MAHEVTVCILGAPDEPDLAQCVASAREFAGSIVVGWAGCNGETSPVPFVAVPTGELAAARNALLDAAPPGGWVLVLDASEQICLPDPDCLRRLTAGNELPAFRLPVLGPAGLTEGDSTYTAAEVRLFLNRKANRYSGPLGGQLPDSLQEAAGAAPEGLIISGKPAADAHRVRRWAEMLIGTGRSAEAMPLLEEACRRHPGYTDLWLLLGQALAAGGRPAAAQTAFRHCIDLGAPPPPYESDPGAGDLLPHLALGALAEQRGQPTEAVTHYEAAYTARPAVTDTLYRLARALCVTGQSRRLAAALRELVQPVAAEQWLLLADVLSVHRQYRQALYCLNAAVKAAADPVDVASMRGFCLLRTGHPAEAEAELATVPAGHEQALTVLVLRLLAAWARRDCPAARTLLAPVVAAALPEGMKRAARGLHQALCRSDSPLPAGPAWGPEGGEFLLQAVDALLAVRRYSDADVAAQLMDRCQWSGGYRPLAMLLRLRGRDRAARACCATAIEQGDSDPGLLIMLADLEMKARHWPRALDLVAQACRAQPDDPVPFLLRARILRAQAIDLLKLADRRWHDPELADLLAKLAEESRE